ncbi:hypothetical protein IJH33_00385 [Candidatus Saccharibacteria bacterium]|nr:hypothetical protein [Candidatus Saccharibacteria bacterium]
MHIISSKPHTLTQKILKSLDPATIVYAEFAESGAMGCPGTARIYTFDGTDFTYYLVETIPHSRTAIEAYATVESLLDGLAKSQKLEYADARYGNHAYKGKKIKFSRDDDTYCFLYKKSGKTYRIDSSCSGVYFMSAKVFAPYNPEPFKKHIEAVRKHLSAEELCFYQTYIQTLETFDDNFGTLSFAVTDYQDAINLINFASDKSFNFSDDAIRAGIIAVTKYRLRYLADQIGWKNTHFFFKSFAKSSAPESPGALLSQLLGLNFAELFSNIASIDTDLSKLNPARDEQTIAALFHYPVFVNFSPEARDNIHHQILAMKPDELRHSAREIAYYFTNYIWHEDVWPLTDVLPLATHVIENLPADDTRGTETATCFNIAGEIINTAWRYLSEDKDKQKKFRDLVYQAYWPRVGSTWPLRHYDEFEFKDSATKSIFDDAVSFVMSLEDISARNREIKAFFSEFTPSNPSKNYSVEHRVFTESLKNLSSKEQLDKILAWRDPSDYYFYLSYPENTEDAKLLLAELLKPDGRITGYARFSVTEKLLLSPHYLGVGEYILKYLVKHFDKLQKTAELDVKNTAVDLTPIDILSDYFTALYAGISEENEFPPAKELLEKLVAIGANRNHLEAALKSAKTHRRAIAFQRASLQKFF